ncbi:hypothetical protein HTVC204P_gp02 [Pelagibacter phage HTVC204P]|nr:hypothetical protein HTVC204P_gp02 [Pelagibacter phage HTVC204P]
MEKKQIEKLQKRVDEINSILHSERDWNKIDSSALICERSEKQFLINKVGVNIRLTGNNKYYWGNQFVKFRKNIDKYGSNYNYKDIVGSKISFNKYSINQEYSPYSNDLWRFDGPEEMKGFVKGYNEMCNILEDQQKKRKVA